MVSLSAGRHTQQAETEVDKLRIENEKLQQQMKQLRLGQSSFTIIIPGDTAWVLGVHGCTYS